MKLSLNFWRKQNKSRVALSQAQVELLRREDNEARKGAIGPFSLSGSMDSATNESVNAISNSIKIQGMGGPQ